MLTLMDLKIPHMGGEMTKEEQDGCICCVEKEGLRSKALVDGVSCCMHVMVKKCHGERERDGRRRRMTENRKRRYKHIMKLQNFMAGFSC